MNIKLHPLLISFSSIPLHIAFVLSSPSSLPGLPDPHRWPLSFTRSFSLVSKSPIALSATQHSISGTDFLHYSDYHVPPQHPPVVLHYLDLLLACLIWCSTLVSKLTFSPGSFLHSFSLCVEIIRFLCHGLFAHRVFRLVYNSTHNSLQNKRKFTTLHCRNTEYLQHGGGKCRRQNYVTTDL